MKTAHLTKSKGIFTLIELLVVIAVISILASLLLPAMKKSYMQAKAIACTSNLKQVGNVFAFYAEDFHGVLPVLYYDGDASNTTIWHYFLSGTKQVSGAVIPPSAPSYIKINSPILSCPKTPLVNGLYSQIYGVPKSLSATSMGIPKGWHLENNFQFFGQREIVSPSRWMLAGDCMKQADDVYVQSPYIAYNPGDKEAFLYLSHNNAANVLFTDGHTGRMSAFEATNTKWDPSQYRYVKRYMSEDFSLSL